MKVNLLIEFEFEGTEYSWCDEIDAKAKSTSPPIPIAPLPNGVTAKMYGRNKSWFVTGTDQPDTVYAAIPHADAISKNLIRLSREAKLTPMRIAVEISADPRWKPTREISPQTVKQLCDREISAAEKDCPFPEARGGHTLNVRTNARLCALEGITKTLCERFVGN